MPDTIHVHTLVRTTHKNRKDIYMCKNADCNYTRNKAFLLHKASKCPFCGDKFSLTRQQLTYKEPRCPNCVAKRPPKVQQILLTDLGINFSLPYGAPLEDDKTDDDISIP